LDGPFCCEKKNVGNIKKGKFVGFYLQDFTNLQDGIAGHGVIHPENASGDVVGNEDIHSVVSVSDHNKDNAQTGD
jgi:hypothetical protein